MLKCINLTYQILKEISYQQFKPKYKEIYWQFFFYKHFNCKSRLFSAFRPLYWKFSKFQALFKIVHRYENFKSSNVSLDLFKFCLGRWPGWCGTSHIYIRKWVKIFYVVKALVLEFFEVLCSLKKIQDTAVVY